MSLLKHTPQFTEQDAVSIVKDLYGIQAAAKPLPSERDQNFRMSVKDGDRFVLKIANALEDRTMLDCQNQTMQHLARHVAFCPRVVASKSGELISEIPSSTGGVHKVRLVTYLPGIPMGSVKRHSAGLLTDLGRCAGEMDRAMADFDHPGAHRDFYWDLANGLEIVKEYQGLIPDVDLRKLIEKFIKDFEQYVTPLVPGLRKSVIHNDANDYNVIVGGNDDLIAALGASNLKVYGYIHDAERIPGITDPLEDGQELVLGGLHARAIFIPAHTRGHLAYYFEEAGAVFTGDTLFAGGCGRLFEGDAAEMKSSLERLAALPDPTRVYCGHEYTRSNLEFAATLEPGNAALARRRAEVGEMLAAGRPSVPTTIAIEKATNPFLRSGSDELCASVARQTGATMDDPVEVFAATRRLKDEF